MVFLVRGRGPENIKENIKTNRRKTLIIEDKGKRKMQGKSKNNNEHLWFYFFYKNLYFTQRHSSKSEKYVTPYNANFHSDGLLDPECQRSIFILENDETMHQGIFSHPVEVTGFMNLGKYLLSYVYLKGLYKNLKEIEIFKPDWSLN